MSCWQGVSRAAGKPTGKKNQPRYPQTALSPDARKQALSSPPFVLFGGIAGGVLPDIPGGIESRPTASPFDPELAHPQAPQMTILEKTARIAKPCRSITTVDMKKQLRCSCDRTHNFFHRHKLSPTSYFFLTLIKIRIRNCRQKFENSNLKKCR